MTITKMPVIDAMLELTRDNLDNLLFENTLFVCNQHLLHTTVDLFDGLLHLGAKPANIFIIGKIYSTCDEVVKTFLQKRIRVISTTFFNEPGGFHASFQADIISLWSSIETILKMRKIDRIIILDDGGFCLAYIPQQIVNCYPVIGIEQTSSGLTKIDKQGLNFPVIAVASSAAKQYVEPPMIAQSVVEKLVNRIPMDGKKLMCGVVGMGSIGKAVAEKLVSLGHVVYTHDKDMKKGGVEGIYKARHVSRLICESDYIFGCSGDDILAGLDLASLITKDKVFISCSSQDKEFHSLLLKCAKLASSFTQNPLWDTAFNINSSATIKILRGGFPINLDNSGYAVKANDIQMTRGLLLAGLIQAALLFNNVPLKRMPKRIMLCPTLQQFVVKEWMPFGSKYVLSQTNLNAFSSLQWIKSHSGGQAFGLEHTAMLFEEPFCLPL